VAVGAFVRGEPDQFLGTGDEVVELLGLAGEELLVVGIGDPQQCRLLPGPSSVIQ
jgi:hypothetical protein